MKNHGNKLIIVLIIAILVLIFTLIILFLKKTYKEYSISTAYTIEDNKSKDNNTENKIQVVEITGIEGQYNHEEYQTKINEIAKKYGAVGCAVALVEDGKVIDIFSYGSAIKGKLPMEEDTKIRIASISKIYVGLAAMISVENGTMSLDEDISTYWGFNVKTSSSKDVITPRSILTHTSSISDTEDVSDTYYNSMANRLRSGSGIRNRISGDIKNYYYNNYAIDVLGMTIELANNKTLDDILSEKIYNKLGIDAAFYAGDLQDLSKLATIYKSGGEIGMDATRMKSWHKGKPASKGWGFAGGVTTSVKDLGKIIALIANNGIYDGKRYLSEASIKELENHKNNNLGNYWQCQPLCYKTNMYGQEEFYYHTGSAYGSYNLVGYNPNTEQGVAILTTGAVGYEDENEVYSICAEIANLLLNIA